MNSLTRSCCLGGRIQAFQILACTLILLLYFHAWHLATNIKVQTSVTYPSRKQCDSCGRVLKRYKINELIVGLEVKQMEFNVLQVYC